MVKPQLHWTQVTGDLALTQTKFDWSKFVQSKDRFDIERLRRVGRQETVEPSDFRLASESSMLLINPLKFSIKNSNCCIKNNIFR